MRDISCLEGVTKENPKRTQGNTTQLFWVIFGFNDDRTTKRGVFHNMSFENWNRFVQEQLSLSKDRAKKKPAATEEIKSEITPNSNKNDTLKKE